jgi:hypothetical protein
VTSRWAGSWSSARVRSTVGSALALRPGRSAQTRLPPTAHLRHAGVRSGVLVLTAGPVSYLYRRHRWLVRRQWRPLRTTCRGERSRPLSACLRPLSRRPALWNAAPCSRKTTPSERSRPSDATLRRRSGSQLTRPVKQRGGLGPTPTDSADLLTCTATRHSSHLGSRPTGPAAQHSSTELHRADAAPRWHGERSTGDVGR